jgi:hypothetical protein
MFENRMLMTVFGPEAEDVLDSYILRAFITGTLH